MLPFHIGSVREEANYKSRLALMEDWGIVKKPDFGAGRPAEILDQRALDEFAFLYFCLWLYLSMWNRRNQQIRAAIIPAAANGASSLLVFTRLGTTYATPGRGAQRDLVIDEDYMTCPLDRLGAKPADSVSKLCPVVNRIRYNLGIAPGDLAGRAAVPRKTEECCDSAKAHLWEYVSTTIIADPVAYGPIVGGTAFPIAIPFERLVRLLGDLTSMHSTEFGKLFEETLLWSAVPASGVMMGLPHATFTQPHEFYETDFFLYYQPTPTKPPKQEPREGWKKYVENDSICVFELTVGHRPENNTAARSLAANPEDEDEVDEDEVDPARSPSGIGGERVSGNDHAKNKIFNFLALNEIGLRHVETHYISIVGPKGLNDVTRSVLGTVDGFSYKVMSGDDSIALAVLNHFETPVSPDTARGWYRDVADYVRTTAETFGRAVRAA